MAICVSFSSTALSKFIQTSYCFSFFLHIYFLLLLYLFLSCLGFFVFVYTKAAAFALMTDREREGKARLERKAAEAVRRTEGRELVSDLCTAKAHAAVKASSDVIL